MTYILPKDKSLHSIYFNLNRKPFKLLAVIVHLLLLNTYHSCFRANMSFPCLSQCEKIEIIYGKIQILCIKCIAIWLRVWWKYDFLSRLLCIECSLLTTFYLEAFSYIDKCCICLYCNYVFISSSCISIRFVTSNKHLLYFKYTYCCLCFFLLFFGTLMSA